jgi:hypothetical protein
MADASGILAQPLLLKVSHAVAQILDVVCRHPKLFDLIHHRLEVGKAGDGTADLSIEHRYIFSSTPKQKGRFDLFETHLLSKEPSGQLLIRGREWALHASSGLKQAAYLLGVVSFEGRRAHRASHTSPPNRRYAVSIHGRPKTAQTIRLPAF